MSSENDQITIAQKFSKSWDKIEEFFTTLSGEPNWWTWLKPILGLIAELRVRGYDQQFRAGQSMSRFVLSRSQEWGLRPEQSFLSMDVQSQGGMIVYFIEPPNTMIEINLERVELTPELEQLLLRLLAHPID